MASSVKVCILAGGFGTRIRGLFPEYSKPMIPISGKPFLEWQIKLLISQGFDNFVLCVGYLSNQIIDYFGDGYKWGINIEYSIESKPLGTAGAIKHASHLLTNSFLVLNGDTYLSTNYSYLIDEHQKSVRGDNTIASLTLIAREDCEQCGCVLLDCHNKIVSFCEKPLTTNSGLVNAGAYILESNLLDLIAADRFVSLETDILPDLIYQGRIVHGIPIDSSFIDMGTPQGFHKLSAAIGMSIAS